MSVAAIAPRSRVLPKMVELKPDGGMRLNLHPGQIRAWNSDKRFVVLLGGNQSGKTSFGPHWLAREIARRGPGDYFVVTPTFPLLETKALPEFRRLFEKQLRLGTYKASPVRQFTFSAEGEAAWFGAAQDIPTVVYFMYAEDADSLESATIKAAWLDEAGQRKFKLASWEAIQRRLSLNEGRCVITTTPYDLGWLKQHLFDPWKAAQDAGDEHPYIDIINFPSIANPAYPQAEFDRARAVLPRWKFDLFYQAIFTKPAGLIYDRFEPVAHTLPADYRIEPWWRRVMGVDFGGVNTAVLIGAMQQDAQQAETGNLIWYREYLAGGRTASQHVAAILADMPLDANDESVIPQAFGGSGSEQHWRNEWTSAGLAVYEPAITGPNSVEIGIDRVYGAHAAGKILVMPGLTRYLEQKNTYSRKIDAQGEPTEEIEDKSSFHFMDAERYLISWLMPPAEQWGML